MSGERSGAKEARHIMLLTILYLRGRRLLLTALKKLSARQRAGMLSASARVTTVVVPGAGRKTNAHTACFPPYQGLIEQHSESVRGTFSLQPQGYFSSVLIAVNSSVTPPNHFLVGES